MAGKIVPLDRSWIPELSRFLKAGFAPGKNDYHAFADPAVLEWKFFQPRGDWNIPRSLAVVEGDKILAHVGVSTSAIHLPNEAQPIPTVHLTDWLTSSDQGSLGAMLMLKAFGHAPVQYTFGCTDSAKAVLLRVGYKEVQVAPLFHRVIRPWKSGPWLQLHGKGKFIRSLAFRALDHLQNVKGSFSFLAPPPSYSIREVRQFSTETREILSSGNDQVVYTSRAPDLLNYYLSHPHARFKGWLVEREGKPAGFAITCTLDKPGARLGRIVELFLESTDVTVWAWTIQQLFGSLRKDGADVVSCYGSTPWFSSALRKAGFFRRGKTPLLLRDPRNLVPTHTAWHLTHLEADLAII